MKGGVILFRGSGADARRYLESDRSRADDYYLEGGTALAEFAVVDASGMVIGEGALTADEYAQWVDWINPLKGGSMGGPPRDLAQIEALPPSEAAQLVRDPGRSRRIAAEQARDAIEARAAKRGRFPTHPTDHGRTGPEPGFGPSL